MLNIEKIDTNVKAQVRRFVAHPVPVLHQHAPMGASDLDRRRNHAKPQETSLLRALGWGFLYRQPGWQGYWPAGGL